MIYSKPHFHFLISLGSHAVQLLPSKSSLTCRQAIVNTLGTTAWTSMAPTFWRKSSSHRRRSPFNAIPFVMVIHASCASIVRAAFVNAGVWLPPSGDGIVNEGWRDGKAVLFWLLSRCHIWEYGILTMRYASLLMWEVRCYLWAFGVFTTHEICRCQFFAVEICPHVISTSDNVRKVLRYGQVNSYQRQNEHNTHLVHDFVVLRGILLGRTR